MIDTGGRRLGGAAIKLLTRAIVSPGESNGACMARPIDPSVRIQGRNRGTDLSLRARDGQPEQEKKGA